MWGMRNWLDKAQAPNDMMYQAIPSSTLQEREDSLTVLFVLVQEEICKEDGLSFINFPVPSMQQTIEG